MSHRHRKSPSPFIRARKRTLTTRKVRGQLRRLETWINKLEMVPATQVYRGKVILPFFSKALTVGRAVCALVDAGFPAEAFGLSRTLIEMYLSIRYMSNKDTDARIARYVEYGARVHKAWGEIAAKHLPNQKLTLPSWHGEVMEIAKKYPSKHQWTGERGQVWFMASEEDTRELGPDGKPFKSEFDYDVPFFWTSFFVHVTVNALDGHAGEPGTVYRVGARRWIEQERGADALFNVLVSVSKVIICGCRILREQQPDEILTDIHNMIRKFAGMRKLRSGNRETVVGCRTL